MSYVVSFVRSSKPRKQGNANADYLMYAAPDEINQAGNDELRIPPRAPKHTPPRGAPKGKDKHRLAPNACASRKPKSLMSVGRVKAAVKI